MEMKSARALSFLWWVIVAFLSWKAHRSVGSIAGYVVGLSGLRIISSWRSNSVQVELCSMAHFACRGAILAVPLALLLELLGLLTSALVAPLLAPILFYTAALGGLEELTKLLALIWLSWSTAKPWVPKSPPGESWPRSQRGVMLAGYSAGVGFMVVENFFAVEGLMYDLKAKHIEGIGPEALIALSIVRILLNAHPWLSGIVAGRFAKRITQIDLQNGGGIGPVLTWQELWTVLWPSITLHALRAAPKPRDSRNVLQKTCREAMQQGLVACNQAIAACAKSQTWRQACGILADMQQRSIQADVITYSSDAWTRAVAW
eukprot:Skav211680  [mRNA]  locus=scaffold216:387523:391978:- [translate_table: standard]